MHRGNPSLTGVVQSSGLRRFQQVKWELEGQFAVHLPLVAGHDVIYATWLTGMQVEIHAMEKATGTLRWLWKPGQNEYAGQANLHLDQGMLYYPVYAMQTQPGTHVAILKEAFLSAFDAQTGQVLRRIPIPPLGNRLVGNLFTQQQWSAKADEGQYGTEGAIVAGELLYAVWEQFDVRPAVINATLFALDLRTGQEYWRFDATELSPPLVTDGNVFLVRSEGEGMSTYLCALA